ncbi:hypothetical protein NRB20_52900 [Nocardia sp. RB20]|uniref:Uncharacterized protein n=1 Tax=Nocardia macrotermitis TaxID=2585198 RepID=A0A7K0D8X5_9NOCA|nr:hypothetical protein [Nocardia macrotermitis]
MDGGLACLLVVIGVIALLIYRSESNHKANNRFRAICGECDYQSTWMTESQVYDNSAAHYNSRHPHTRPGGTIQIRL